MEIEFVSDDSDDNINDACAVFIFAGLFLIDMARNGPNV
jgi:hypothetical protein